MEDIGLFEAIYSQRQFTRYRTDPVPREAIDKITARFLHKEFFDKRRTT